MNSVVRNDSVEITARRVFGPSQLAAGSGRAAHARGAGALRAAAARSSWGPRRDYIESVSQLKAEAATTYICMNVGILFEKENVET